MINTFTSYYYLGGGIPANREAYVERDIDRELYNFLTNASDKRLGHVLAARQMGKTSLAKRLTKKISNSTTVFVETTLQIGGECKSEDVLYTTLIKHISKQVCKQIRGENLTEAVLSMMNTKSNVAAASKFCDCLEYILEKLGDKKLIIFLDEIQCLFDWELQNGFLGLMRTLAEADQNPWIRMKLVLLGVINPDDLLTSPSYAVNHYQPFKMTNLKGDCESLQRGLKEVTSSPAKVVTAIQRLTGGKPYLMQYFCERVRAEGSEQTLELNNELKIDLNIESFFRSIILPELKKKDPQNHFNSIRNWFLSNRRIRRKINALILYKQILEAEKDLTFEGSYEQKELIISGLVEEIDDVNDIIDISCPIYREIFDINWTERTIQILTQKLEENMPEKIERDYVLIIDRSPSMNELEPDGRSRWETIQEFVCDSLTKKMSEIDMDGMVVYFFSGKSHRFDENITPSFVRSLFRELGTGGLGTDLAGVLKDALDDYFQRQDAGLIKKDGEWILIITDGQPNQKKTVFDEIVKATQKIKSRSELAITFLRIGQDADAINFLKEIDDDLIKKHKAALDICDTKDFYDLEENDFNWLEYQAFHD